MQRSSTFWTRTPLTPFLESAADLSFLTLLYSSPSLAASFRLDGFASPASLRSGGEDDVAEVGKFFPEVLLEVNPKLLPDNLDGSALLLAMLF